MSERQWRVRVAVPIFKLMIAATFGVLALVVAAQWWQVVVAVTAAAGLVLWAARDLVAPVRLAADESGMTLVVGFARRHRLDWTQVERVRVDARRRSRLLEVDTGETLYLFSRYDLGADLDEVADELERLRTAG